MASIWDTLFSKQDYRTAAPSGGYADLYANGLLGNRTDTPTSVGAMETGKDFIPGIGDAIALKEAYDAASRGDKVAAGLLTAGAALGLIPGAGDAVARPVMAAGRKAADVAGRIEVDPNAVGSLLGNVRVKPKGEAKQSVAEMRRQANIDRFGFDPNEASAAQPSAGLLSDYAGEHRAPMRDGNAPAFNLAGDIYPDDIYSSNAVQYYGTGNTSMDRETMGLLQSLRGQPDAEVTIYRATPKGVKDLNAGDWVTVNKQYAQDHGEAALGGDFEIIERKVKAGEIFTNGDSIHEFGYDPSDVGSAGGNARVKPEGIKAYHGSPHDFDKFSMDAIGTGEGAQAYGHGLYLAEAEDVAKKYRDDLSGWGTAGAQRTLEAVGGDVDRAISETQQKLSRLLERNESGAFEGAERNFNMQRQIQKDKIHQLESYRDKGSFDAGHLYEVNIAASPDDFLDYDAPLTGQTGKVAEYISNYEALTGQPILEALPDRELTGKDLYTSLVGKDMRSSGTDSYNKSAPSASKYLFSEGVPGIKYKDAGSRGTDAATQNFVVFDDNLISIVKKYGIAGAAAMLGVSSMDVEQAMAQGAPQDSGLLALREEQKRANEEQYKRGLLQ